MINDVFYFGKKPNVYPKEKFAEGLDDARRQSKSENFWIINEFCDYTNFDWDFDFDLLPDEEVWAKDHINIWPSVHQKDSGTWLCSKNKSDIKIYRNDVTPLKRKPTSNWIILDKINLVDFDFSWHHDPTEPPYIYTWGNKFIPGEVKPTLEYHVSGATQRKYMGNNLDLDLNFDMFFVDCNNSESNEKFQKLKIKFPNITKTRFVNSWIDTISRCINKSKTKFFYILDSQLEYEDFSFDFFPDPWQTNMVHIFGTQWSHWGTTFLINKDTFENDTKYIKIIEHLSNINFVKSKKAKAINCLYDVVLIDFGNTETSVICDILKNKTKKQVTILPYKNSYHETLIPFIKTLPEKRENYLWVCSSICDYTNFDFSYICDPFSKDQLHVFPSEDQKYGDTFLIDVDKFKNTSFSKLNDYEKINFNQHQRVKRLPCPIIETDETHCNEKYFDFDFPYAVFTTSDNYQNKSNIQNISLWDKDKTIVSLSEGNTQIVVPKIAKKYLKKELYDYPFIVTSDKLSQSQPMDIVFLSNGEKCADEHYNHLLKLTKNIPNQVYRVDGIQGRVKSFQHAASVSKTPWAFIVFAKLKVNENFDFDWQPDRLQAPKHYIFYARNPVNNLIYGHQSMACYNKNIVLNTKGLELDFTMEGEHTVVELLSGTAHFNTDEYSTWRTAFRECIKLSNQTDIESKERLDVWLNVANGNYADSCLRGSNDAVEYFESVNGDFDKLKLTYEWDWLENYYKEKYG